MKIIFLFISISFAFLVKAQPKLNLPFDSASKSVIYTEIITRPDLTKDNLYILGREWVANAFKSSKDVIQLDDKESGKIIGKGNMGITLNGDWGHINFTIILYFKDGKYKYEIKDITHEHIRVGSGSYLGSGGAIENEIPECGKWRMTLNQWEKIKVNADKNIQTLIGNLKQGMTKSNNW